MKTLNQLRTEPLLAHWKDVCLVQAGALLLLTLFVHGTTARPLGLLRVVLGVMYVLFVPGYCLISAIFTREGTLEVAERLALSIGVSAAIVPLLALVLNQTSWGIKPQPMFLSLYLVMALANAVAIVRRSHLAPPRPSGAARFHISAFAWRKTPPSRRQLLIFGTGGLLLLILAGTVLFSVRPGVALTEFYIVGRDGLAQDYPRTVASDNVVGVDVTVVNRERDRRTYRIEIWASDIWNSTQPMQLGAHGPITLHAGEQYETHLSWNMPRINVQQQLELLLFYENEPLPYRKLSLWLRATP